MNASRLCGSSARPRQLMVVRTTVIGGALSALLFGASSAAAASTQRASTPVPKTCPPASVVSATLKHKVSKVTSTTASTATESKRTCTYKTSVVVPTTITFGSPVTAAAFAASQKAAGKGVAVVTVHGLGNAAWAVKRGNGLAVLKGTLDIVISAPETTDAELEALARKIL
jgi:hypothetical protein